MASLTACPGGSNADVDHGQLAEALKGLAVVRAHEVTRSSWSYIHAASSKTRAWARQAPETASSWSARHRARKTPRQQFGLAVRLEHGDARDLAVSGREPSRLELEDGELGRSIPGAEIFEGARGLNRLRGGARGAAERFVRWRRGGEGKKVCRAGFRSTGNTMDATICTQVHAPRLTLRLKVLQFSAVLQFHKTGNSTRLVHHPRFVFFF